MSKSKYNKYFAPQFGKANAFNEFGILMLIMDKNKID